MHKAKRILTVDDDRKNVNLLTNLLESLGYDSEPAYSGAEALEKLNGDIDLVLLDAMMPDMDGFDVTRRIRSHEELWDIPVMMVTILSSKEDRLRAVEAGANDFICKPIDRLELRVRVASLLKMKEAQDRIKASLREKEALLREVHHRVKNNFAVMSSLLRLQARHMKDEALRNLLKETEFRIQCMGLVHEKLHQSETLGDINVRRYLTSLIENLIDSYGAMERNIRVQSHIERMSLGVDSAIAIGFITSELFSNCLKHAFPADRAGRITIGLKALENEEIELSVADDGVGLPEEVDWENLRSLGIDLARTFARQLGGELEMVSCRGTEFIIRFKEVCRNEKGPSCCHGT